MHIRKRRIDKGWSQETLAEVSGLSVRTVQRLERGGKASLETMNALAAVLEVDVSTLTRETGMNEQDDTSRREREAVEYVRDIKGFYTHLAIYVISVIAMAATNLLMGTDYLWFIWPALGWGLGVIAHGLTVFEMFSLFGVNWGKAADRKATGAVPEDRPQPIWPGNGLVLLPVAVPGSTSDAGWCCRRGPCTGCAAPR